MKISMDFGDSENLLQEPVFISNNNNNTNNNESPDAQHVASNMNVALEEGAFIIAKVEQLFSFRFVSFLFLFVSSPFCFVSFLFCFVSFRFVSFRFVSFRL